MISGIWILVTGIIGVVSSRKPTSNCWNGTHMAFNIVAAFLAFGIVVTLSIAIIDLSDCEYINDPYYPNNSNYRFNPTPDLTLYPVRLPRKVCSKYIEGIVLAGLLIFVHTADFAIALSSSILCCIYSCRGINGCCAEKQKVYLAYQPQPIQHMYSTTSSSANYTQAGATNVTYSTEEPPQNQENVSTD